jgi:hypothetical protein
MLAGAVFLKVGHINIVADLSTSIEGVADGVLT